MFKDLFAANHSVRVVRIDGEQSFSCPVVRVSDSPEDLRHLLRACFSKRLARFVNVTRQQPSASRFVTDMVTAFRSYGEEHPSYHEISATIRLGDKYKIGELYVRSVEYLKRCFPSTLSSWTALNCYSPSNWINFEEIGVINIARATGELSLLPTALLTIICGWKSPHGTGIVHDLTHEDEFAVREYYPSPEDVTVCFDGKTKLHSATITVVMRTFKPAPASDCKTPANCRPALRAVLVGLEKSLDPLLTGNPFGGYEAFVRAPEGLDVCAPCLAMVQRRNLKEHKDVWDRLPELLGIDVPGWKQEPPPPQASNAA